MKETEANIRVLSLATISNAWLLRDARGRQFLIDTGDPFERPLVNAALHRAGVAKPGDLTAILLTHRHRDHAGNAAHLRERYRCPVVAHVDDAPYLEGEARPPRMSDRPLPPLDKILCAMEDLSPARCPVDEVYQEGKWKWGFEVHVVGGHTTGSVMLYHRPSRTLFSGDAILVGYPPLRLFDQLRMALPEYSVDVALCRRNVRAFLDNAPPIERLCSGHGPLLEKNVEKKLHSLRRAPRETGGLWLGAVEIGRTWWPQVAEHFSFAMH
jgi:glyoxylase-like metal-dependent hydrolase (beta-lactamase superfamily II)